EKASIGTDRIILPEINKGVNGLLERNDWRLDRIANDVEIRNHHEFIDRGPINRHPLCAKEAGPDAVQRTPRGGTGCRTHALRSGVVPDLSQPGYGLRNDWVGNGENVLLAECSGSFQPDVATRQATPSIGVATIIGPVAAQAASAVGMHPTRQSPNTSQRLA